MKSTVLRHLNLHSIFVWNQANCPVDLFADRLADHLRGRLLKARLFRSATMPHRLFFTVVPPRRTAQSYGGWFKRPIGLVASYFGFAVADVMQMRRRCGPRTMSQAPDSKKSSVLPPATSMFPNDAINRSSSIVRLGRLEAHE